MNLFIYKFVNLYLKFLDEKLKFSIENFYKNSKTFAKCFQVLLVFLSQKVNIFGQNSRSEKGK